MNIKLNNRMRLPAHHIGEAGVLFILLLLVILSTGVVMHMLQNYEATGGEGAIRAAVVNRKINEQIDVIRKRKALIGSIGESALATLVRSDLPDDAAGEGEGEEGLLLTGVIWSEHEPLAIIGSKLYGVGDSFSGEKVIAIGNDYIVLEGKDGERRIGLYDSMEDFTIDDGGDDDG